MLVGAQANYSLSLRVLEQIEPLYLSISNIYMVKIEQFIFLHILWTCAGEGEGEGEEKQKNTDT